MFVREKRLCYFLSSPFHGNTCIKVKALRLAILIFNFDQKFSSLFDGPNDNLSGVKGAHYIEFIASECC